MIKLLRPIQDLENTMVRPIVTSIIESLKRMTNLPLEHEVLNPGEGGAIVQQNGAIKTTGYDRESKGLLTSGRSLISVSVEDTLVTEHVLATPVLKSDAEFIFHDAPLEVVIVPSYALYRLVIGMRIRFPSRKAARNWYQQLNAKISSGFEASRHTLTYSYSIPPEIIYLLMCIHERRENYEGYGDTLQEWLKASFDKRLTIVSNQAGKNSTFTIPEHQIDAVGKFDTEAIPRPENSNDLGAFEFNLNYEVFYKKPTNLIIQYPELIHNQFLPKPFDGDGITESFDFSSIDRWGGAFAVLGLQQNSLFMPRSWENFGMSVPWYDRWLPKNTLPMVKPVLTLLCQFNPEDKSSLLNLNDLVLYTFDEDVFAYIQEAREYLNITAGSPIKLTLYRNDAVKSDHWLTVDEELNVSVFEDVSLRQLYRLQIGLYCGLASLPEASKQILLKHGSAARKFIRAACPAFPESALPPLQEDGSVTDKEYMQAARRVEACVTKTMSDGSPWWTLVGLFSIVAQRK